jgi:hypothetical protein
MARIRNPNLKKSGQQDQYTIEQISELKKCMNDPVHFISNYVKIQHPKFGVIPFKLRPYQVRMVESYKNNRFNIILASRQVGKALFLNTEIPTPTGWTTMENIKPGHYVLDCTGNPTLVTGISDIQYNKRCFNVHFSTGEVIGTDGEHLWEVELEKSKVQILTTQQMFNSEVTEGKYSVKLTKPLILPKQNLPIDPYIFSIGLKNTDHKHIPMIYLRASYEQRLSLLQGIMDTTGTVTEHGMCELTSTNETLIKDCFSLICTLGLKPTLVQQDITWTITFTTDITALQLNLTIVKIERVDSVPVKCISIDSPDHLYLVGQSMIPTHNSDSSGADLLWYACFNNDKTILVASNKNSNAMEMIRRIRFAYENLPMWLKPGISEEAFNKHEIGFDNGSRILSEATSEKSGRGLSIALLYLDEFAHVAPEIQEEFWTSIEPTLSTGGSMIISSTPNGDSDIFAQLWNGAQVQVNGFVPIEVKWDEPPGRDAQFKEETIGRIGELKWKQEYECLVGSSFVMIQDNNEQILTLTVEQLIKLLENTQ